MGTLRFTQQCYWLVLSLLSPTIENCIPCLFPLAMAGNNTVDIPDFGPADDSFHARRTATPGVVVNDAHDGTRHEARARAPAHAHGFQIQNLRKFYKFFACPHHLITLIIVYVLLSGVQAVEIPRRLLVRRECLHPPSFTDTLYLCVSVRTLPCTPHTCKRFFHMLRSR